MSVLTEKDVNRFLSKVDRSGGPDACWNWLGSMRPDGYGVFQKGKSTQFYASRIAFFLANDQDPGDLFVCHSCDSRYPVNDVSYRRCCNPAHFFLGDHTDNMLDASKKGRLAFGKRNGSCLHPETRPRGKQHGTHLHPETVPRGERLNSPTGMEL